MRSCFKALAALLCICAFGYSSAHDEHFEKCRLEYRPSTDEIAVVATGVPLVSANRRCETSYLNIHYDQEMGPVSLPKGRYFHLPSVAGSFIFRAENEAGDRIQSCLWCDRIDRLMLSEEDSSSLCVLSYLNVRSCAISGAADFTVERAVLNTGEVCVPSLAYYGRSGNELLFAVNDCKNVTRPALIFDLSLGNVIRFFNERIEILRADNDGIRYRRLGRLGE